MQRTRKASHPELPRRQEVLSCDLDEIVTQPDSMMQSIAEYSERAGMTLKMFPFGWQCIAHFMPKLPLTIWTRMSE